ncbi:MAG: PIG-L family deacetylase [Bacteroidia bacterium]|nr:PIG-L family deacetylase [Bacteroidia bacterium]
MRQLGILIVLLLALRAGAQMPMPSRSAADIQHQLRRLQVLGSVLYVAAHPDDENTRLIAYYAKGKGYRTAYLSLTRGDGGQNLIGNEQGIPLGVLRTQELLAARRIDGGEQFFTRAYDFGYSKTHEETLSLWNKQEVLADIVWVIRSFRPDVIITRFPGPEKGGGGHGHHTSSFILTKEAFALAGRPDAFPEQLQHVSPWQPKRLFWNNYQTFREDPAYQPAPGTLSVDMGGYDPLLGKNYGEIAAEARSMHRCQAFGTARNRGSIKEYLEHEAGEPASTDAFDGVVTTWDRIGEAALGKLLAKAYAAFDPEHPEASVPLLLKAWKLMEGKTGYWYEVKRRELQDALLACAGIWLEADASQPAAAQGDSVTLTVSFIKRNPVSAVLQSVSYQPADRHLDIGQALETNTRPGSVKLKISTAGLEPSRHYWLERPIQGGSMFAVADQQQIGRAESAPALRAEFALLLEGVPLTVELPVIHKYVDRSVGEIYQPFVVTPPFSAAFEVQSFFFPDTQARDIQLQIRHLSAHSGFSLELDAPAGWGLDRDRIEVAPGKPGAVQTLTLRVQPPAQPGDGMLRVYYAYKGRRQALSISEVRYDHIPAQQLMLPAALRMVRCPVQTAGKRVAYLMGSGDEVPAAIAQLGYQVDVLEPARMASTPLDGYDAVVAGIRAYNTIPEIQALQERVLEYVSRGGVFIAQYNTNYDMRSSQIGPYRFSISRDRVSDETAPVTLLAPEHPALSFPNAIREADFKGWVQEIGLYFPASWDDAYTPLLACSDPGEPARQGALLVARHGEGYFVYTALSFFRQLPAGVPGAGRLFANLLSLSHAPASAPAR